MYELRNLEDINPRRPELLMFVKDLTSQRKL